MFCLGYACWKRLSGQGLKLGPYKRIHFGIKKQKVMLRYVFQVNEWANE